jgi:hypothetical protein
MRLRNPLLLVATVCMLTAFSSCTKEAGPGGTSTITGKIVVDNVNGSGISQAIYDGAEERVYITYGDNEVYDDDTRTGPDGRFKFDYLHPGSYKVFVYSDCLTCDSGTEAVEVAVEIADKDSEVVLEDIIVLR